MSYKGFFINPKEAAKAKKHISYIPSQDGKIMEVRDTLGFAVATETNAVNIDEIQLLNPSFINKLPKKIPFSQLLMIISLARHYSKIDGGKEVLVDVYWDSYRQRYHLEIPKQKVSKARVHTDEGSLADETLFHFATGHSHNTMAGRFSRDDDDDDRETRVYFVIGRLDCYFPEISVRVSNGGKYLTIDPSEIFQMPESAVDIPEEWHESIEVVENREQDDKDAEDFEVEVVRDMFLKPKFRERIF